MQQKILNNRYELEQKIGEGGMARVYRGRDLRLSRRIAVKVLHSHYASDAGFLQRFHHEAQAAANLRHPNIVDVYDVGQDGDIHYIVMEYVEGSDLKHLIRQSGGLPVDQAVQITEAVAEGLDTAHRFSMVHRDVKPQNIIVGPGGQVKITDFGIAKSNFSSAMTETGVTFGTADYISPEQARGQVATPRSDIYSLGVTLYEMLTGQLPFTGDSSIGVAMQHVSAEPPPPRMLKPHIPPQLEALVLRALSKNPDERPATGREFARLLQNYRNTGEQDTVVRPAGPRPAPQPAPRPPQQAPRPVPQPSPRTGTTGPNPRVSLPPPVVRQPPDNRGMGFGGFVLGLLLLGGIIGLVWLFMIGAFNDLLNFPATAAQPTAIIGTATPTEAPQPTEAPTSVPQVVVPSLAGLNEQQALDAIEQARLSPQEAAPRYSDTIAQGFVIDQFPLAGLSITETSIVTFAVSLGQDLVEVPDVQRRRLADGQRLLEGFGFAMQVQEEQSATVGNGFIIRQSPQPGDKLPRGETVTIVVSIGNDVTVPELAGLTEDEAKQRLAQAGLVWSFTDYQDCEKLGEICDRFGPGIVVSSDPRVGTVVSRGSGVTLGVRAP